MREHCGIRAADRAVSGGRSTRTLDLSGCAVPNPNQSLSPSRRAYFCAGFVFGACLVGALAVRLLMPAVASVTLAITAGVGLGVASARWGDAAWVALSKWLRMVIP